MAEKEIQNAAQKAKILQVAQMFLMQIMINGIPARTAMAALRLVSRMMEKAIPVFEAQAQTGKPLIEVLNEAMAKSRENFEQELDFIIQDNQ